MREGVDDSMMVVLAPLLKALAVDFAVEAVEVVDIV
jgi:hypothetical protein